MKCILVKGVQCIGYTHTHTSREEMEKANLAHKSAPFQHYLRCLIPTALACVTNEIRIVFKSMGFKSFERDKSLIPNRFSRSFSFSANRHSVCFCLGKVIFVFACHCATAAVAATTNSFAHFGCRFQHFSQLLSIASTSNNAIQFILWFVFPCRVLLACVGILQLFVRSLSDCFFFVCAHFSFDAMSFAATPIE